MKRNPVLAAVPVLVLLLGALLVSAPPTRAATPVFYPNRAAFEGAMGAIIVDDYGTPPYPPGFGIYDNLTFSAFLGETDYETTGFQNWNMHQANDTYCAGCNGSFRLSFGTTSFTVGGVGVYGVAVDITANSPSLPYYAYITYGDGTTDDIALPSGPSFFGVSAPELIVSVHFGLSGGGSTTSGSFVIDNLTIASQWPPVDLGDFVWYDTNQDGIQDVGEPGVENISVDLYDNGDCAGSAIATEVTDASGHYSFTDLFSGTYCLQFYDIPAGWLISPPDQGADDALDSDADPATGQITTLVLTTTDDLDEDMGLYTEGSAGDTVWCDADYNGLYDPGEGVPSVTVSLYEDSDCDTLPDAFLEAQDTITDGQYLFAGLPVGPSGDPLCYNVAVDVGDMGACNYPITPITQSAFLDSDAPDDLDNDFGFAVPLILGDLVWYDTNQDGIQDLGEPGVPSITVALYDNGICTGTAVLSTTTNVAGGYSFDLVTGTYCLQFYDIPAGWLISPPDQGGDDALDSDADPATGQITDVVLFEDDLDEDMGLYTEGSAGDTVWCDADYNGLYDPGEGVPSVTVSLYEDSDCDTLPDAFLEAQDTITDGQYLFAGLPVGPSGDPLCYNVAVDVGDMGACNYPITPITQSAFLDSDAPDDLDNDFGFNVSFNLGDLVWYDTNQDGIQDLGEPGVPSITVALYDNGICTGTAVLSTTTNVAGGYSFSGVVTGTYCLQFYDIPAGWLISPPDQGADDALDSDADPATGQITDIVLLEDDLDEDMGLYACDPVAIEDIAVNIDLCTVTFTASLTGTGPFAYLWGFGDGVTSTETMPTHVYTASGTYTVTLTVQNCGGNYEDSDSTVVTLDCMPRYYIYLPLVTRGWGGGGR